MQQTQTQVQMRNRRFYNYVLKNENNEADIMLYGNIGEVVGYDDITDQEIVKQINDLGNVSKINLRINSLGGSVFPAIAIYNVLKTHSAEIVAHIDGICASSATIIASSANKVIMPKNALYMIHNPATMAYGESKDLEKTVELLDVVKDTIIETYMTKTGQTKEKLAELMDNETWLTAQEAKSLGFIDEIVDEKVDNGKINNTYIFNGIMVNGLQMKQFVNFKDEFIGNNLDIADSNKESNLDVANELKNNLGGTEMEEKKQEEAQVVQEVTKESILADYSDIYAAIKEEGIAEERARIQAIEDLGEDVATSYDAKFTNAVSPDAFAMSALKAKNATKINNENKLKGLQAETKETAVITNSGEVKEDADTVIANRILNQMKGRVK